VKAINEVEREKEAIRSDCGGKKRSDHPSPRFFARM
jgi:hypothetical protein